MVPYPSLAAFAETPAAATDAPPAWVHAVPDPLGMLGEGGRRRLDELLDTVVAVQRAEWLNDGVWIGPNALPDAWHDLFDAARLLQIELPPAVVSACSAQSQGAFGTDARAFLHLSSFFLAGAPAAERRFVIGRSTGQIAARHVSFSTARALLVDQGGLRAIARQAFGPAFELILAPLSLGLRVALASWHRAAEISADRAGLLVCGDYEAARQALLRVALGVRPPVDADGYLAEHDASHDGASPGRFAELLQDRPWLHKRMRALALFARSEPWVSAGHRAMGPVLSHDELAAETDQLLRIP